MDITLGQLPHQLTMDPFTVRLIIGLIIPVAVGVLAKSRASDRLRGGIMLVLSAVGGLIVQSTTDTGIAIISGATIKEWALTVAAAIASYYGVWRNLNVNDWAPKIGFSGRRVVDLDSTAPHSSCAFGPTANH